MSFVSGGELLLSVSGGELLHWHTVPFLARSLRAQFFSDFSGATLNPGQLRNQIFEAVPSSLPGILSAGAFFCLCKANANANAKARFFRHRFGSRRDGAPSSQVALRPRGRWRPGEQGSRPRRGRSGPRPRRGSSPRSGNGSPRRGRSGGSRGSSGSSLWYLSGAHGPLL